MADQPIETLVLRSLAGDLGAYEQIVSQCRRLACSYAYSILRDEHLAEDVVQEAFAEAYQCLRRLRSPRAFRAWLKRIVLKHCDRLLRVNRVDAVSLDGVEDVVSREAQPDDCAARREMRAKIDGAVESLPAHERRVTALFYIHGFSQREVADTLSIPVTTVKNRLRSSRATLKRRIMAMVRDATERGDQVQPTMLRELYGLDAIESWRWVPAEPEHVARFACEGREFALRVCESESDVQYQADYMMELHRHDLAGERTVLTSQGEPHVTLSHEKILVLCHIEPGSLMDVPFGAEGARTWGRLTAEIHLAGSRWRPQRSVKTLFARTAPDRALAEAERLAKLNDQCRETLDRHGNEIVRGARVAMAHDTPIPVHGDLWPGRILKTEAGLKAIDFRTSGIGPPAIDMATAFRWMPWRKDARLAAQTWRAWLDGYESVRPVVLRDLDVVPALGALQCLHWLVVEMTEAKQEGAPPEHEAFYLRDHSEAICALMSNAPCC